MTDITFGSLFSGAGGLDLGLEQAGMKCTFQVENDKHCLTLLNRHWPDVPKNEVRPCMGLVGGDPCPIRSQGRRVGKSSSPDLSGYFLAMAERCEPRWILRENVPAPDARTVAHVLDLLGYRTVVMFMESAAFTGCRRLREFVVGFSEQHAFDRFVVACNDWETNQVHSATGRAQWASRRVKPLYCLTTRERMDARTVMVFEGQERGLRVFSHTERESLQGFPPGWTDGIPKSARERAVGNAVTVPVAKWLGERIVEALSASHGSKPPSHSGD